MRLPIIVLLVCSVQTAFALPSATPEQCAEWTEKITEYTEKQRENDSLEKQTYYLGKVEEYQRHTLAKRCGAAKGEIKENRLSLSDSDRS